MSVRPFGQQLTRTAVLYVYAVVNDLAPAPHFEASDELATELTDYLVEQDADPAEVSQILMLAQATEDAIAAGSATPLSAVKYDNARAEMISHLPHAGDAGFQLWPPTSQTVSARLGAGNWNAAIRVVGIPESARGRAKGSTHFSREDFCVALREFSKASPEDTSYRAYQEWVVKERKKNRVRPAGATVRKFFRSWSAAKAEAGVA